LLLLLFVVVRVLYDKANNYTEEAHTVKMDGVNSHIGLLSLSS